VAETENKQLEARYGYLKPYYLPFVGCYCTTANRSAMRAVLQLGITTDHAKAHRIGVRMLERVQIRRQIERYLSTMVPTPTETLATVAEIMNQNMGLFYKDEQINLDTPEAKSNMHLVKKLSIRETKYGKTTSIELYDKMQASELMMRYHKLISSDTTLGVQVDVNTANAVLDSMPDDQRAAISAELQRRLSSEQLSLPAGIELEEDEEEEEFVVSHSETN
jgi:hypothetical protein